MPPAAAFHAQLASIMEVLANTAVAEICDLVDSGYSVLQLEISRSRKENELLRRKLRLMELRTTRASALRAAVTASGGGGLLHAHGRARAQLTGHPPGRGPRRTGASGGETVVFSVSTPDPVPGSGPETTQQTASSADPDQLTPAVFKVEDNDESWTRPEPSSDFCRLVDGQNTETEDPPPVTKQEVTDDAISSCSWANSDIAQRPETSNAVGFDHLMFDPQLPHGPCTTQNALGEDLGHPFVLNAGVSAPGDVTVAEGPQRAGLAPAEQHHPDNVEATVSMRPDEWRRQDDGHRARGSAHREDGGGSERSFVCNFCGKTLACLKNLKTHLRVHTGEKPFMCALCGKRFSDSSNLKRHQSVHTGEKRYGCVHCGKRFAQSGSLKVHMTVHTDCKQFKCSICGKTFISIGHLRRHISVHAGDKRHDATA